MNKTIFFSGLVLMYSCIHNHRVDVWKTITIAPRESISIDHVKAPATIEVKNLSEEKIALVSSLNMPNEISGKSEFTYRLPKKGILKLENRSSYPVSIDFHYYSSRSIMVNNKEFR
ncbi:hypothetical protein VUJ46_13655 [Chryseobacterium sp. MYb264]|uniref:hypothetical protein n=1 Tax=Chryseobacterium sp. MYb264 TaxID=2745153 RepID=UPI002E127350|nr:hypothetical protein VUJ46_13655 [Chryseobacterium sp. MYb264]